MDSDTHEDETASDPERSERYRFGAGTTIDVAVSVGLLIAAYLVRRTALPTDGLLFDDSWVVVGASKGGFGQLLDVSTNHPGFTAALMVWARTVSRRSELFAWIPFVFGVVAPAVFYLVGALRLRISRPVAAAAAIVFVIAPEHAIYSSRVKPYVIGTLLTVVLAAAVPWLAKKRWGIGVACAWVGFALLAGSVEALSLVVTAVAILVMVAHPAGDRLLRVGALLVQGLLQAVLLVTVQGRFASATVAKEWETTYDGYLEPGEGVMSLLRQIGAHVARLGQNVAPGSKLSGVAVVAVALAGLCWRARRGDQRIAARFLLALFVVSFVGGLVRQIPFGPRVGNPAFPGGRANLWMLPVLFFGLAWAVDAVRLLLARVQPRLLLPFTAAVLAGALAVGAVHFDDSRTYPLPGEAWAARKVLAAMDDSTMVIVFPAGQMTVSAEPGIPVRPVADRKSHQGFMLRWTDPRWNNSDVWGRPRRFEKKLNSADRVIIHDGLPGFGDGSLADVRTRLRREGFRKTDSALHGIVLVEVWDRENPHP
ncbi:MAG: hypothetical protein KDB02_13105 [Acidimicrobiales bacterium]|nr:hypothetical protein [Acidimicrobiales bacterium]